MTTDVITPDQLPDWVPGELTVRNPDSGWNGLTVRGYRYAGSDVEPPPLRDFLIVAYQRGTTEVRRRVDGRWTSAVQHPGGISLMTNAVSSHWIWPEPVEVVHVYLAPTEVGAICRQMYEREVDEVRLRDVLRADDPAVHRAATLLATEAAQVGVGSGLLIDSIACQLSVHILRRYADVMFRETVGDEGLTVRQERTVRDYIRDHLDQKLSLEDMAASVALSRFHFCRRFRQSTGFSPHDFVIRQRVELAKTLLARTKESGPDVAIRCGFADQSHLTRVFKKHVGVTPGQYRAQA